MRKYRKAIAAALGAAVLLLNVVANDGRYAEACGVAIAALNAVAVYLVPNETDEV